MAYNSRWGLFLIMAILLVALAGCKIQLYSELDESSANDMLAYLLKNGIDVKKTKGKETWGLEVEEADVARAMELLQSAGLPREKFVSIGDVFQKKGLISSPLEERIRFIYALAQELSRTISQIDGVITARVHIVLPENDALSDELVPSSASVFIKHLEEEDIASDIPQIKKLVINGIEGLSYDKVTVVLFPTIGTSTAVTPPVFRQIAGVKVATESVRMFQFMLAVAGGLFLLALYTTILLLIRQRRTVGEQDS